MDQQNNGAVVNQAQQQSLIDELGLTDLPQERKNQLLNQMVDSLSLKILNRISTVLTDEDIDSLDKLSTQDETGELANQFLMAKVPNFNAIALEETEKFKQEMKDSLEAVKAALPQ
jgi:hypothetical protein